MLRMKIIAVDCNFVKPIIAVNCILAVIMENVCERIKSLVEKYANGKVARFSRLTGIKYTSIRYWLKKGQANLTAENLEKICSATGVSADWLLFGSKDALTIKAGLKVPLIEWHAADDWGDKQMGEKQYLYPDTDGELGPDVFALEVPGSYVRMIPRIEPGVRILVDPKFKPHDDSLVLVMLDGETLIARFRILGKIKHLTFDNQNYSPIRIDKSVKILGVVIKIIIDTI